MFWVGSMYTVLNLVVEPCSLHVIQPHEASLFGTVRISSNGLEFQIYINKLLFHFQSCFYLLSIVLILRLKNLASNAPFPEWYSYSPLLKNEGLHLMIYLNLPTKQVHTLQFIENVRNKLFYILSIYILGEAFQEKNHLVV